ncbi:MAG: hypothetical protein RL701_2432 [Pseudomonadota bacterium]|jgi:hypothetical protein
MFRPLHMRPITSRFHTFVKVSYLATLAACSESMPPTSLGGQTASGHAAPASVAGRAPSPPPIAAGSTGQNTPAAVGGSVAVAGAAGMPPIQGPAGSGAGAPAPSAGAGAGAGGTPSPAGTAGAAGTAGVPAVAPVVCPATALPPGETTTTLQVKNVARTFILYVPKSYTGKASVPFVVDWHSLGSTGAGQKGIGVSSSSTQLYVSEFVHFGIVRPVVSAWSSRANLDGQ